MAHFAKVINGIVVDVIVAEPDIVETLKDGTCQWIQTSYNTLGGIYYDPTTREPSSDQSKSLRKNFAMIGGQYDSEKDAFIHIKPFHSWKLNENTCLWEPPIPEPKDGKLYRWVEEELGWVEIPPYKN